MAHGLPNGYFFLVGCNSQAGEGRFTNSAPWQIDNAPKGLFVAGIDRQAHIGQNVLDFFALVKGESAINLVGNVSTAQRVFKGPRLGIRTVQNGKIAVVVLLAVHEVPGGLGHILAFVRIADALVHYYFFTQRILGPNVFLKLLLVVRNQGVGRADDALGAAVVLL